MEQNIDNDTNMYDAGVLDDNGKDREEKETEGEGEGKKEKEGEKVKEGEKETEGEKEKKGEKDDRVEQDSPPDRAESQGEKGKGERAQQQVARDQTVDPASITTQSSAAAESKEGVVSMGPRVVSMATERRDGTQPPSASPKQARVVTFAQPTGSQQQPRPPQPPQLVPHPIEELLSRPQQPAGHQLLQVLPRQPNAPVRLGGTLAVLEC